MPSCPCCGGNSRKIFEATVLGKHRANYAVCAACDSMHVVEPFWLDEAYADPRTGDLLDTGASWRNTRVLECLRTLQSCTPTGAWLDYGSGQGYLRSYATPQEVENYDPKRGIDQIKNTSFSMIACVEVLEHVQDPAALLHTLKLMLQHDGIIALSTWLREPTFGPTWSYLAPQGGQHITFPSRRGFAALCQDAELQWLCSLVSVEHPDLQVHLLSHELKKLPLSFNNFTIVPACSFAS